MKYMIYDKTYLQDITLMETADRFRYHDHCSNTSQAALHLQMNLYTQAYHRQRTTVFLPQI